MAAKRMISTTFWTDRKVDEQLSSEDKFFFLYLMTNPFTTQIGIYEFPIEQAAHHLKWSVENVKILLNRFETEYDMIKYSKKTGEVAIKNYLRYSIGRGGKPVLDWMKKEEKLVKDKSLLDYIQENLKRYDIDNKTVIQFFEEIGRSIIPKNGARKTPTLDDVKEYCSLRKSRVDPEAFWLYYEEREWDGVKNWKSVFLSWEKRMYRTKNSFHNFEQRNTDYDSLVAKYSKFGGY